MGKIAFIFPGQGAQSVGMVRDVYEHHAGAKALLDQANEVLGYSLTDIMFNGPEEKLKLTIHTQPALLAASIACLEAFREKGIVPDFVAGHSLGEYSALVAAGVLRFEDALRTVRARGEFMDQAVPAGQGAMAAVLGAERQSLSELCAAISRDVSPVELANVNCPGQIVVSGGKEGVQAIAERAKAEAGAKRVIPLEVSGPFHSSLMQPASKKLEDVLASVEMKEAAVQVIANVHAQPVRNADEIRTLLVKQVYSAVLWEDSVRYLIGQGVDTFIELGAGSVLSGLVKKTDRKVKTVSLNNWEAIKTFGQES